MRASIGVVLIMIMAACSIAAEEKFDAAKLVGKWEEKNPKKSESMSIEFTKDGKFSIVGMRDGNELKASGTYKLSGDKLTLDGKVMDNDVTQIITISKLSDDELTGSAEGKDARTFKKVKAKK
jgi:uncharacterized protein (TIGR03066 family)